MENGEKTKNGEHISSYECDPITAQQEFMLSKSEYELITGRNQGENDVIAYHLRQSFKPNEITPELANKIGYDLAMSLTKGKHAFVVCTHIDKQHIHSHIVFNSTALDCERKFRNFWGSSYAIRKISDRLCLENGLSIVENPNKSQGSYADWLGEKPQTFSEKLKRTIDEVLSKNPSSFDEFLQLMQQQGYEIKQGKYIAFKSKEQKKFIRLRSLGEDYSEEKITQIIQGELVHKPMPKLEKKVNLIIDIQEKLNQGKGEAYEQWAKIFNLKQMAKTLNYLSENNLIYYEDLCKKVDEVQEKLDSTADKIQAIKQQQKEINALKNHIIIYLNTREIYAKYKRSGYSKEFLAEHEYDIGLYKTAAQFSMKKA